MLLWFIEMVSQVQ